MIHKLDLSLPYVTPDLPGVGGAIRARPELFVVEEIPAYEPIGYGDHIYLSITKQLKTTRDTQIALANLLGLQREVVGHAGLKDKNSISTQVFSVLLPSLDINEVVKLIESNLGVTVNWAKRHPRKLRSGHLRGNRFKVVVTGLDVSNNEAIKRIDSIRLVVNRIGIPNYFGPQRFGRDGGNIAEGYDIITGKYTEHNRWLRRLLVSSYLSHICNNYIAYRVKHGIFNTLLRGDLAKKHDTGGVFTVEDPSLEQPRCDTGEISFSAPIFGFKMRKTTYESGVLEDRIFSGSNITIEQLRKVGADGTRRIGRLLPNVETALHQEGLQLSFTLPAGGYATVVLREFMKMEYIEHHEDKDNIVLEENNP